MHATKRAYRHDRRGFVQNGALPSVLIAAIAFGTQVVSTASPSGPASDLENGRYGRLVPVDAAAAVVEAITKALDALNSPSKLKHRAADFTLNDPWTSISGWYRIDGFV